MDGDGYPRGKQFLLIQRSHPHGGASLVDSLLDLSPSRAVSFPPFLSVSHRLSLSFSLLLSLCLSFSSLSRRAREPGFCEQVLLSLPPSTVIRRTLLFPPFRRIARNAASKSADRSDLHLVGVRDRSFRARDSLRSDDQTSRYSKLPTTYPRRV